MDELGNSVEEVAEGRDSVIALLIPRWNPAAPKGCIENMRDLALGRTEDLLAFIHSDVEIYDPEWQGKVEAHFLEHGRCGLLGFGGALGLGHPDIYKRPYQLQQLARFEYFSAVRDWETHGYYLAVPKRVAMLDGFALIFRREAYEEMGGWTSALEIGLQFHMYDFAACCMMERLGWEVWAIPMDCLHKGGGVSVSTEYDAWLRAQGIAGDSEVHTKAHEICYREFKDILPWRIS